METNTLAIIIQPAPDTSYWEAGFTAHIRRGRILSMQGMGGITQPEDVVGILHKDDQTVRWQSFLWSHYTSLYLLIEYTDETLFEIENGNKYFVKDINNIPTYISTSGSGKIMAAIYEPIEEGTAAILPDMVQAGNTYEFVIDYVVGKSGINQGGGIRIQTPYSSWSFPKLFDNSVTLTTAEDAEMEYDLHPYFHPMAVFGYVYSIKVTKGRLNKGDSIRIQYSNGEDGIKVQTYSKINTYFPIHLDAIGNGIYYPLSYDNVPSVCVNSSPPARIRFALPMVVSKDEIFDIKLAVLDDNYNPVFEDFNGKVGIKSDSAGINAEYTIGADEAGLLTFKGMQIKQVGIHIITAYGDSLKPSSLVVKCVEKDDNKKLYWGAIHGHTMLSDGEGNPDDYYPYGRYVGLLDFCAMTDHDWELAEHERCRLYGGIRYVQDIADEFYVPGSFVTIPAYEWMGVEGHANVYFNNEDEENPIYVGNISIVGNNTTNTLSELLNKYKNRNDIMIIPHTSHGFKWTEYDASLMPVLEIYSCWGPSEFKNNPDAEGAINGLNKGFRLGFIGGADSHHANPGNTCKPSKYHVLGWREGFAAVYTNELTRDRIFSGIKSKSCYAATAERILLEFDINGNSMGSSFKAAKGSLLTMSVLAGGTTNIRIIELICNGEVMYSADCSTQIAEIKFETNMNYPDGSYFYAKVTQIDDECAWSSPIWIDIIN